MHQYITFICPIYGTFKAIVAPNQTSDLSKEPREGCLLVIRRQNNGLFGIVYINIKSQSGYIEKIKKESVYTVISAHCFDKKDILEGRVRLENYQKNYYSEKYYDLINLSKQTREQTATRTYTYTPDLSRAKEFLASNVDFKLKDISFPMPKETRNGHTHHPLTLGRATNFGTLQIYSNSDGTSEGITIARGYFKGEFNVPEEDLLPGSDIKILLYDNGEENVPIICSNMNGRGFYAGTKKVEQFYGILFQKPKMGQGTKPMKVCKVIANGKDYWPVKK